MGLFERLREKRAETTHRRSQHSGGTITYVGVCTVCREPAQGAVNVATGNFQPMQFEHRCYKHGAMRLVGCVSEAEHNAMGPILDALADIRVIVADACEKWNLGNSLMIKQVLDRLDASAADVTGRVE